VTNTGSQVLKNAFIENVDGIQGSRINLPDIEVGKSFNALLVLQSVRIAGKFASFWRVAVQNSEEFISDMLVVEFELFDKPVVAPKKVEEKIVEKETAGKEFPAEVMTKAKLLHECLPQYTLEFLTEAVSMAPNMDLEDLMTNLI